MRNQLIKDPSRIPLDRRQSFTIIELLAVVVVICILIGLSLGVASYFQRWMNISSTKSTLAAIEVALESYKADWGYYPASTVGRISANGYWEATNNWLLYRALSGANGKKKYLSFPVSMVRSNTGFRAFDPYNTITSYWTTANGFSPCPPGGLLNIVDAFGMPLNYYNSPTTPFAIINNVNTGTVYGCTGYTVGGQVNVNSYDLFSYGKDQYTFVPGAYGASQPGGYPPVEPTLPWQWPIMSGFATAPAGWTSPNAANDDLTNWRR